MQNKFQKYLTKQQFEEYISSKRSRKRYLILAPLSLFHVAVTQLVWDQFRSVPINVDVCILFFSLSVDFYSAVRQKWVSQAKKLRNITVLSVGGGYRDYQVRSGLTSLPSPPGDPNKMSLVVRCVCGSVWVGSVMIGICLHRRNSVAFFNSGKTWSATRLKELCKIIFLLCKFLQIFA